MLLATAVRIVGDMRFVFVLLLALLAFPQTASAQALVRVRLVTSLGAVVVALDAGRAPRTTANFLAYVDDGRLDGTEFYRAARIKADPKRGFVQGGIGTDARRMLPSVPLEQTRRTGIKHMDATISMAHGANPDSATGNFSIMVGPAPSLDANYAAFGRVVSGMEVVKRMLALPTGGGRDAMKGQMILKPVKIMRAERLDGTPKPTGKVKPWKILPKFKE